MSKPITVRGLAEFSRSLRQMDAALPKELRVALNEAANIIVVNVQRKVPRRSGRAARSVTARSTRTLVRVSAGGPRAPYYPWLDFGGRVGRKRSVHRRFIKSGRYIYPTYSARRDEITRVMDRGLTRLARSAGLEVT